MKISATVLCVLIYFLTIILLICGITFRSVPAVILGFITMLLGYGFCRIYGNELVKESPVRTTPASSFDWQCSCGIRHQKYETSCICGKTKKEILASNVTEEAIDVAASNQEEFAVTPDKMCFCRKCGEKLVENSNFCGKCGTKVIRE